VVPILTFQSYLEQMPWPRPTPSTALGSLEFAGQSNEAVAIFVVLNEMFRAYRNLHLVGATRKFQSQFLLQLRHRNQRRAVHSNTTARRVVA
jgi:hypothetical protein